MKPKFLPSAAAWITAPTLLALALLGTPTPAAAQDCNSLYAARIAEKAGVADCQTLLNFPRCPAGTTANQCADATWLNPPAPSGGNGPFRSKFVSGPLNVRCVDGTRPRIYVDKAMDIIGNEMATDNWLIYTGGEGGPCTGSEMRIGCYEKYVGNTSREHAEALSSMHPDGRRPRLQSKFRGLLDPRPVGNPARRNPFAAFNRIYVERCTTGVSQGFEDVDLAWTDSAAVVHPSPLTATTARVYHHGDALWQAIFEMFDNPAARDLGGGGNAWGNGAPDLPPLRNATTVLLTGHSDAAKWLIFSADHLEARIQALDPGTDVNVAVALDAHAVPSLQLEMARNDPQAWPTMFLAPHDNTQGYSLPDDGDGVPGDEGFGNDIWQPTGPGNGSFRLIDGLGAVIDTSCEAMHGAMSHECLDDMHVAFNHLSTPVFFRQDQRDGVFVGKPAQFGHEGPPVYNFPEVEFQSRVLKQFIDYTVNHDLHAHLVSGNPKGIFSSSTPGSRNHTGFVKKRYAIREKIRLCENGVVIQRLNLAGVLHDWLMLGTERTVIAGADAADLPAQLLAGQSWVRRGACPP